MNKILLSVIALSSCSQVDLSEQTKTEIIEADKVMSGMAAKEGFYKALLAFADDKVIKPEEGQLPVIGNGALTEYWAKKKDIKEISWEHFRAEGAKSGEIGYTFGNWKYQLKDTT